MREDTVRPNYTHLCRMLIGNVNRKFSSKYDQILQVKFVFVVFFCFFFKNGTGYSCHTQNVPKIRPAQRHQGIFFEKSRITIPNSLEIW